MYRHSNNEKDKEKVTVDAKVIKEIAELLAAYRNLEKTKKEATDEYKKYVRAYNLNMKVIKTNMYEIKNKLSVYEKELGINLI